MTALDSFLPFVLYYEAGLRKSDMTLPITDLFCKAAKQGYSDDPDDAGGATLCGVTLASLRHHLGNRALTKDDLRTMPFELWREILARRYWQRWQADRLAAPLAWLLVDWVWASGVHGIKIPQRILGVSADGVVGEKTLAAIAGRQMTDLFDALHKARIDFVNGIVARKPSQRKFLRGWLRRINAITPTGLLYV